MSDEPLYSPRYRPPEAPKNRPAEPLWSIRFNYVTWSCELRFCGESYGWSATVLRDGELFFGHGAFVTKAASTEWATELRREIEGGLFEHG
jgi:hypothetical protein